MKNNYALFINGQENGFDTDMATWFAALPEAIKAGREAVADGDDVKIMAFNEYGEAAWDAYIEFDEEGRCWSDDTDAFDAIGGLR